MNYPLWEVPILGGSWMIGLISCIHIFISHFAVGGGMFLALTEWLAYRRQDESLYAYLKKHSLFFLLITTVAGAVTGVGIWWAISLVNPDGIETLIQLYTLGWACEYIFFVAELATIFVYYASWDRIPRKTHLQLAIAYAVFSIFTLVIINGILSFMLTTGTWPETQYWLNGFFNQTYWPSLIMRLCVMAAVTGMYALVTSAKLEHSNFRTYMLRYSAKWFLPIFIIGPVVAYWYLVNLPADVLTNITTGIQASGIGNFSILARALYLGLILSGTVLLFAFVGPYLNPKGFSFKMALVFMVCGLLVTSIGEFSREMLRKPYVVYGHLYSNGLRVDDIPKINSKGYLASTKWQPEAPTLYANGKAMFQGQCMACHTKGGYRSMKKLLGERDEEAIRGFLTVLHETDPDKNPYHGIMPPVVGNDEEIDALATYLSKLNVNTDEIELVKAH
jgi:cytochrome bd-type quinol oxidase subunit 1